MKKNLGIFALFLGLLIFMTAGAQAAINLDVRQLEVNGFLSNHASIPLVIERSDRLDIVLWFSSETDYEDIEIRASISGYEYSRIEDVTSIFDVTAGQVYKKTLTLELPEILETGNYKLRLDVVDKNNQGQYLTYDLFVGTTRNMLSIRNVMMLPGSVIRAGDVLVGSLRLENLGEKDEVDVKIEMSIPELDLVQVEYVDKIEKGEILSSPYIQLQVPTCTPEGVYSVDIKVSYNRNSDVNTKTKSLKVVANADGLCGDSTGTTGDKRVVVTVGPAEELINKDSKGIYSVVFNNKGDKTSMYEISANAVGDWGNVEISPSIVVVEAGKTATAYISVTPDSNLKAGKYALNVDITEDGRVLKQVPLTAEYTAKEEGSASDSIFSGDRTLEVIIAVLLIILIIVGIIVGIAKSGKSSKESEAKEETYY
jgi:uncharacterized membrane protein